MTSGKQDFKIFYNFMDIFVLLVTFEILSHFPIIDSSHWLKEHVQWITDRIFRKKLLVQTASTFSSQTFLLNF